MQTIQVPLDKLIFAEYNPRQLTRDQYKDLKDSIQRFGMVDPLIINTHKDRKNILVGGHQRARIAMDLGFKDVPCVTVELNPEMERELNIRLNKNTGEWDWDALANSFDVGELTDWGFTEDEIGLGDDDFYTKQISPIVYEPKNDKPEISELFDLSKTKELIEDIENNQDLSDGEKEFLVFASYRHIVFNYSKIADFYAHSSIPVKKLMEDSALIIVDADKAVELGYMKLTEDLIGIMGEDYAE